MLRACEPNNMVVHTFFITFCKGTKLVGHILTIWMKKVVLLVSILILKVNALLYYKYNYYGYNK